ncbi:hypothetical protein ACFPVX_21250 [Cohnella faecalis]|nr:hypothetical protein [Cohnella faecalis]
MDTASMRDPFEMMTYLLVILISAVVMTVWLKIRGKRKRNK